ncbi:MAG: hypothetical protein HQK77_07005 [Desulfobacterales bacterium]|nr:hypothetical protein [Desulfobacterales bacterium]
MEIPILLNEGIYGNMIEVICTVSLVLILVFLIVLANQIYTQYLSLHRIEKSLSEIADIIKKKQANKIEFLEKQKLAETVVHKSSTVVEQVHRTISDITFGILESIPATKHTAGIVKIVHNKTSDAVYDSVRLVNKHIGDLASIFLNNNTMTKNSK